MKIEELLKALGLDGEDATEKAEILKKEYADKQKELNEASKKAKELEEAQTKLTEDFNNAKAASDKFDIVVKAYGLDLEAEDFDKMLDDVKDRFVKDNGGNVSSEEMKTLTRDLTKAKRELEKANGKIKELTEQLVAEQTQRINAAKRDVIHKALVANNVIKPDMMIDMFFGKVTADQDGKTFTMKDAAGNEISVNDGIMDWAKDNKEFVKEDVRGGLGSGGGTGGSEGDGLPDVFKLALAQRAGSKAGEQKTLGEEFGR